jgi:hypothetical protein
VIKRLFVLAVAGLSLLAASAGAAVLFPEPLHLTRTVENPFTQKTVVIDEYCIGNRVISITEDRTVIADYEKGELTEIDRASSTYSVTKFEDLARTMTSAPAPRRAASDSKPPFTVKPAPSHRANTDFVEAQANDERELQKMEVGVDRTVRLSRDAAQVLTGGAYPNPSRDENNVVFDAAAPLARGMRAQTNGTIAASSPDESYGLPVEQTLTYRLGTKQYVSRMRITRVEHDMPPASALVIPNGAKQVTAPAVERKQLLEEIETLPPARGRP